MIERPKVDATLCRKQCVVYPGVQSSGEEWKESPVPGEHEEFDGVIREGVVVVPGRRDRQASGGRLSWSEGLPRLGVVLGGLVVWCAE